MPLEYQGDNRCFECGEPSEHPFCSPECEELNAMGGFVIYMDRIAQREVRREEWQTKA